MSYRGRHANVLGNVLGTFLGRQIRTTPGRLSEMSLRRPCPQDGQTESLEGRPGDNGRGVLETSWVPILASWVDINYELFCGDQ